MQNRRNSKRKSGSRSGNDINAQLPLVHQDSGMGRPVRQDQFVFNGEEIKKAEPYRYTMCGLDNIFLLNGYVVETHDGEEYVSIKDRDGLHKAIGRYLIRHRKGLAPKEIRFLRKTMDLTQAELAEKLGNDSQSVARWEKGICEMPGMADKLLRITFLAANMADGDEALLREFVLSALSELDALDEWKPDQAEFKLGDEWNEAQLELEAA